MAVGKSASGNVCVWIIFASNRFCFISAAARWVALRGLVAFEFRPELSHTDATVALRLRDGRVLTAHHDSGVPAPDLDVQAARLAAKFQVLAVPVLGAARAETLGARVLGLGRVGDVGEVMVLAGG